VNPTSSDKEPGGGWIVGIDIGGTFTDAVALSEGGDIAVVKVPSTPSDPSGALMSAVSELCDRGVVL
jgi:N-methylhydantoinase A